jgi:hypothetical protein
MTLATLELLLSAAFADLEDAIRNVFVEIRLGDGDDFESLGAPAFRSYEANVALALREFSRTLPVLTPGEPE